MYDLPKFNPNSFKNKLHAFLHGTVFKIILAVVVFLVILFYYLAVFSTGALHSQVDSFFQRLKNNAAQLQLQGMALNTQPAGPYVSQDAYEQDVINAVKSASPSVVSIVISKNLPTYQEQMVNPFGDMPGFGQDSPFNIQVPEEVPNGTKLQEIGAGSGFIVSSDGLVLTNKHVVSNTTAEYTVFTNDGTKYPAKVLALDPVQDLAIVKIEIPAGQKTTFPAIKIGDSDGIQIGQTAIAIGNALGQFSNTVSVGVVSGLGRSISASEEGDSSFSENLEGIIQTDAAINPGNSGGPLLNLKGEVMGINTATAEDAQSIGFAIPINIAKKDIQQIIATNTITYPFLGVRYLAVDSDVEQQYNLSVDYGALVVKGLNGEPAVTPGSAADKAGLKVNDVILEFDGQKINSTNTMEDIIQKYNPGDKVALLVLRGSKQITLTVTLGTRPNS